MTDLRLVIAAIKDTNRWAVLFYLAFAIQTASAMLFLTGHWYMAPVCIASCVALVWITLTKLWDDGEDEDDTEPRGPQPKPSYDLPDLPFAINWGSFNKWRSNIRPRSKA